MKITVFGVGAVGGMAAARLAGAGEEVSVVARGETLAAIQRDGLILEDLDGRFEAPVTATDDPAGLPPQDVLVLGMKAHQIAAALPKIRALLTDKTLVVPAINGLPWWFFQGREGPLADARLASLDPDGALAAAFAPERLAGCVVYVASEIVAPGRIKSQGKRKWVLGPVTDGGAATLPAFADALGRAGYEAPIADDIRHAVWMKLWGNMWANPLSVATQATMGQMVSDDALRATAKRMMVEAQAIAAAVGVTIEMDLDKRVDEAAMGGLRDFRTSMLQDFDRNKPIELDAILGAIREIGQRLDIPHPVIDAVYGIVRLRAKTAGLG